MSQEKGTDNLYKRPGYIFILSLPLIRGARHSLRIKSLLLYCRKYTHNFPNLQANPPLFFSHPPIFSPQSPILKKNLPEKYNKTKKYRIFALNLKPSMTGI